jgi:hypothetical protein
VSVADAHPGDGKRFVVRADERLATYVEATSDQDLKKAIMVLKSVIELHHANSITQTSSGKSIET